MSYEQYAEELAATSDFRAHVEENHRGLGDFALFSLAADLGNRAMLGVGISGCGKSTIAMYLSQLSARNVLLMHGLTVSGLKYYADELTDNSTSVLIEDLARSGTDYMQIATVAMLAGLSYTGFIRKVNGVHKIEVRDCKCSAIIYTQPLILKKLVQIPEFESDIRDKCIRYYYMRRPTYPIPMPISTFNKKSFRSIDRAKVDLSESNVSKYYTQIVRNFEYEVSGGRALEHTDAMLKGLAIIAGRDTVLEADAWLLLQLTKNFYLEEHLFDKYHFEGSREIDVDVLPLLIEVSCRLPNETTVTHLASAYKIKPVKVKEILDGMGKWAYVQDDEVVRLTDFSKTVLRAIGIDC